jgi:hypothetical protein
VEKMGMTPVPVVVPIWVVTFGDMTVERGPGGCSGLPRR